MFKDNIPNISPHNASQKLTELFAEIIYEVAAKKPTTVGKKKASEKKTISTHDKMVAKVLASGETMVKAWSGAVDALVEEQEHLSKQKVYRY